MLTYLADYADYFGPLRLLRYLTVRTALASLASLLASDFDARVAWAGLVAAGCVTLPMQAGAEYNPGVQVRYDASGNLVGVTVLNAQWLLDRDSEIVVTLPGRVLRARDLGDGEARVRRASGVDMS